MTNQWPKKLSARGYRDRWYADLTTKTICNRIKSGKLPGGKEDNGKWFVWVYSDYSAAFDYTPPTEAISQPANISEKAQSLVDSILSKHAAQ